MDKQALVLPQVKGQQIAHVEGAIRRFRDDVYYIKSQSGHGEYTVFHVPMGWRCSCPDAKYRFVKCKHQWAVELSKALREHVASRTIIEPIGYNACPICKSENIVKHGLRKTNYGSIQRYICKSCGHWFVFNLGFEKMRATPQVITSAMQLYFSGESLRNTARSLRMIGVEVSPRTILRWIDKYTVLMEKHLAKIQPQLSDTWRADEMFLKMKGNLKYLYALMDDQTRFWIAQEVADTKYTADVRPLFQLAKQVAGKAPKTLVSDGAANFHEAYEKEFYTRKLATRTEHIREIALDGVRHNNKMERMNGEIRDRERVMRTLEKADTPIQTGMQIYHNYVRPHEALKGKTPSEVAGIKVEGENKWLTLIQNASRKTKLS
jgi:transposase-like protein